MLDFTAALLTADLCRLTEQHSQTNNCFPVLFELFALCSTFIHPVYDFLKLNYKSFSKNHLKMSRLIRLVVPDSIKMFVMRSRILTRIYINGGNYNSISILDLEHTISSRTS